ncbi:hypothetical protein RM697_03460 [Ichthyenterobacterium sp. W332]|uniref:Lipocalin-like domain-containing protein n=1 Tax=Microcosmobacter mediterraneus TaxID=3075607 RepID=A0ABU2YIR0_9FLAO|nr:hypothetical protein [Ichthyenterobacterium sp. W332]MDT0557687.1 hypothetical protein [Ichthyenterobacterium sp. W332]
MKTLFKTCLILFAILLLSSCSSDDEGNVTLSAEGEWLLTSLSVESSFDFNNDGTASRDLALETMCYAGNYIDFFNDNDVEISVDFTYIFVNNQNMQDFQCQQGFGLNSTWIQNGNTVTVENGDDDIVGTISGNTLTVTVIDGFEIEVYNAVTQQIDIVDEDFTIIFTKS